MSVIGRKLKKARREAAKRERAGVLPLVAFYGRKHEIEIIRDAFYADMAAVFAWPTRYLVPVVEDTVAPAVHPGRGGRGLEVEPIDQTRGIILILNSAPLEWLLTHGHLESKLDRPGVASVRLSAGLKVRELMLGAERSGLRSANLEGASGAGGAPIIVNDFMIDCSRKVDEVRESMRPSVFKVVEAIVYRDEWLWENRSAARAAVVLDKVQRGLDSAAVVFGMITQQEFSARWELAAQRSARPAQQPRRPRARAQ